MEGIELDIIYESEKTAAKLNAGIVYPLTECEIRVVTFYKIDAISTYLDEVDQNQYSTIYVGGEKWICALPYPELKNILAEWKTSKNTQS